MTSSLHPSLAPLDHTIGLWTGTAEIVPASEISALAASIESMGFAALWLPEAWGRESFTHAALHLGGTQHLRIATGIANAWARDAVAASAATKTLHAAFGGRFVLGLGVSHAPLVERLRGHDYAGPVAMMRAYLEAFRAAPNFSLEGSETPPVVIAALGPKMLALAAELADGIHPYLVTTEHTAQARQAIGDKFIGVEQAVVLGGTREEFLSRAHAHLEIYTGLDNYRNSWRRLGFGDDDFVRGGSERLCEAMVVHGDVDAIGERVQEHFTAGANHVCLQVLGADPRVPPLADWQALARLVAR
jgi:probable F420-dependent oxidoreductase